MQISITKNNFEEFFLRLTVTLRLRLKPHKDIYTQHKYDKCSSFWLCSLKNSYNFQSVLSVHGMLDTSQSVERMYGSIVEVIKFVSKNMFVVFECLNVLFE